MLHGRGHPKLGRVPTDRFQFGEFEFDPESGELRRPNTSDGADVQRLPPQPARMLTLLLDRRGEVLTREEIRERIWPGVQLEFDASLHFCIRQIRSALGDSATDSRYVETLPRRGYRLIPDVRKLGHDGPTSPVRRRSRWPLTLALLLAVSLTLALVLLRPGSGSTPEVPLRVAIMPFEPPVGMSQFDDVGPIADWILEELTTTADVERAGIVGPTTTVAYAGTDGALRKLATDYELDYIVNGRFLDGEGSPRMLAELISVSDGAHVWVEPYEDFSDSRRIGLEIGRAVVVKLELSDRAEGK